MNKENEIKLSDDEKTYIKSKFQKAQKAFSENKKQIEHEKDLIKKVTKLL